VENQSLAFRVHVKIERSWSKTVFVEKKQHKFVDELKRISIKSKILVKLFVTLQDITVVL